MRGIGSRHRLRLRSNLSTRLRSLLQSLTHIRSMLSRSATLRRLSHDPFVTADAHSSLPVPGQCVMSCKHVSTETFIWLVSGMDFGVPLQVVSANKAFITVVTLVLAIAQVCLDMRLYIFLSAKSSATPGMKAHPFPISRVWAVNKGGDLVNCNSGLVDGRMNSSIEVEVANGWCTWRELWLCRR